MAGLKQFQTQTARPLPVIVLADTSGSMNGYKIDSLNKALKEMIATFADESRLRAEIQLSVITFGGSRAEVHLPLISAHQIEGFTDLPAGGVTPMGGAFMLASELIEDQVLIPSRAYKPMLVLISDGHPNDEWETPFMQLIRSERASKATRFAMAIGDDVDKAMLSDFANDPEAPLFEADNARDIHRFFKAVTMSVSARSQSATPNQSVPLVLPSAIDEDGDAEEWEF